MSNHVTTNVPTTTFEDWYKEMSHDWQERARKLQARRWIMIQQKRRGGPL